MTGQHVTISQQMKLRTNLIEEDRFRTVQAAGRSDLERLSKVHQVVQTGHTSHFNTAAKEQDEAMRSSLPLNVRTMLGRTYSPAT